MIKILLVILFLMSFSAFAEVEADDLEEYNGQYICFRSHLIKVRAEYDRVRWPDSAFTNVCSLSLQVVATNPSYFYITRKWRDPIYCKKFLRDWTELRKKNKKVCIAADLWPVKKVKYKGKVILERSGYWEIIRSGKWCRSYFVRDNCD